MRFANPGAIRDFLLEKETDLISMPFPAVRGRMDAAESLKMMQRPTGETYYIGPGGRELTPEEVNLIMRAGVRGA
jgi:hypothetical protein